jgi:stearoyl-CoA desaturase (Delta-9 desaturase)
METAAEIRIRTVRERTTFWSRLAGLVAVVVPPVGLIAGTALLWNRGVNLTLLAVLALFYVPCGLGITIGWHRYFSHKSFETGRVVKAALAILGSMAMQGPLTQWVTDHRKHHALSDQPGDPHSPHAGRGRGLWERARGLWHSHVGWLFSTKGLERGPEYGKDLYDDTMIRWIDRLYLLWVVLTVGLPFAIGWAVFGTWQGATLALVWGGLIRIFMFQHVTFSINSICHMYGKRPFRTRDESRNVWLLALPSFGESWHNGHHAFPASAVHGLERGQVDLSAAVIRGLERIGLVWDVKRPAPVQVARRRSAA